MQQQCYRNRVRGKGVHGFTLVEVLVTLGIVLTLAVLLVPAASRIRLSSEDVLCSSNLRQIGFAVLEYAHDNNGTLPGPLNVSHYSYKSSFEGPYQLSNILENYLPIVRKSKKQGYDVFMCPAFKRVKRRVDQSPIFQVNAMVPMGEEGKISPPFGYPNKAYPALFGTSEDYLPKKLIDLADIRDAAGKPGVTTTWMMKDLDNDDPLVSAHPMDYSPNIPKTRVHGDHRNAIFFDFHMEKIDWIKK